MSLRKLYIIGNGFDLAHGLETSFDSFLLKYFKSVFKARKGDSDSEYCYLTEKVGGFKDSVKLYDDEIDEVNKVEDLLRMVNGSSYYWITKGIYDLFKNHFHTTRWSDAERLYFEELKRIVENGESIIKVEILNKTLDDFSNRFSSYLVNSVTNNISARVHMGKLQKAFDVSTEYLVVNFNYTNTIELYCPKENILDIHGKLSGDKIVIGYGDEHDKHYRVLEDLNDFQFLKHSKSIYYGLNKNYDRLISFMEKRNRPNLPHGFEVSVLGHSCGLSDRTLLKEIFNHHNCKKIKIFYHQNQDNFTQTLVSMSRHFDDKTKFRKKVDNFEESRDNMIPQFC